VGSGSRRRVRGNGVDFGHWTISCRQAIVSDVYRGMTYPIDTGDLEPESSSGVIGTIEVVSHDQDDIEQFSEACCALEIGACLGQ
jgi:hypothetical protein